MPSPSRPLQVALVGTGAIAGAQVEALRRLEPPVDVVAAVDVDEGRARAFADMWRIGRVARTLGELFAADRPDVVHICTPPVSHVPLAVECLAAGVVPVVEKPPAMSLAEFDELAAAERASTVSAACIFQHRFGSAAVRLREWTAAGRLGRPLLAAADTYWYRDDDYFAVPWRGSWELEGGGPTMGHGIHQFDLLLSILGPWAEVRALAGRQARPTDTEDVSLALVSFRNGAMASVVNSVVSARQASYLRFDFENATVEVEHLYGYQDGDWVLTPAPGHEHLAQEWAAEPGGVPSGHDAQFGAVYEALAAGTPPPVTVAEARRTVEFVAALYGSAFTARAVRAGELDAGSPYAQRMGGGRAPWNGAEDGR